MDDLDPLIPLAQLVELSPEECLRGGLRAWVEEVVRRRQAIYIIKALREAAGIGIAAGKNLVGGVGEDPGPLGLFVERLEHGDVVGAGQVLRLRYHVDWTGEDDASGKIAGAIARAFRIPAPSSGD